MSILVQSGESTTPRERPTARIALSAVISGALLALALLALVLLLAAAGFASAREHGVSLGGLRGTPWAAGVLAAVFLGTFVGGRFSAVNARAMIARDGLLAGFLTWALLVLMTVVTVGAAAALEAPATARLAGLAGAAVLWKVVVVVLTALVASLFGGARGARAEARAIGLRGVRPPIFTPYASVDRPVDLEAYERGFFADPPDQASAGASYPS